MKNIVKFLFLFIYSGLFSQEVVKTFPLILKGDKNVFQIIDKERNEISLFLTDKKEVSVLKFSPNFVLLDSLTVERPDTNFESILGFTSNESTKQIFWKKNNDKEILRQSIDFSGKLSTEKNYTLDKKQEKQVLELSENNKFIVVTVVKNSNKLKFYIIDNLGEKTEKEIDLGDTEFFNSNYQSVTIYSVLQENFLPSENTYPMQKITAESQVSLTAASKKRKYYIENNRLQITFDNSSFKTQVLTINLYDFSFSKKDYNQPIIKKGNFAYITSNSFVFKNNLYQMKVTSDFMIFTIKDLDNTIIKEFKVTKDEEISFKNDQIIQIGSDLGSGNKTLNNSSQYLRKISILNPGISCYTLNGKTLVTIGSVSEASQSNAFSLGMFGLVGSLASIMITNPVLDNFNAYANRKVVYFNCYFDEKFNSSKENLESTAFDKLDAFTKNFKTISSPTAFKINKDFYFGYYNSKQKEYKILKFQD